MADKFSIDDIISEYSEKVEKDLKTDESQENDEILNEDTNIDESIEKDNDISDIDSDGYDPIKATDFDDELASDHTNEKKRNEENAALINNLTKHKKGKAAKQSIPPVNRASLKDIKMGLTGKIIPKTEEFDKALIPDDATYEEKSSILSQHRKLTALFLKLTSRKASLTVMIQTIKTRQGRRSLRSLMTPKRSLALSVM